MGVGAAATYLVGAAATYLVGEIRNKAISASNEVEVEVEAELGNIDFYIQKHNLQHYLFSVFYPLGHNEL